MLELLHDVLYQTGVVFQVEIQDDQVDTCQVSSCLGHGFERQHLAEIGQNRCIQFQHGPGVINCQNRFTHEISNVIDLRHMLLQTRPDDSTNKLAVGSIPAGADPQGLP
ncbi:hypothetical protein GALL_363880 [mine drainage metagenome]|uniref:Uncharacterized protein n=1 Tax=mine drainage metagenome TaxID=410659 RepID=A0A1J5QF43_9ZZZZ